MTVNTLTRRKLLVGGAALLPAAALIGCRSDDPTPREPTSTPAASATGPRARLPAATRPGAVHLTVADLDRSVRFYTESIGLRRLEAGRRRALLGTDDEPLVVLHERPGARPSPGTTGLYHLALLVPERQDLARWLVRAGRRRVELTGLSDHWVSEAIYLDDPDGHGLEIYADRPRELWEGRFAQRLVSDPLDVDDLVATLRGADLDRSGPALPRGTRMGHVHLRVAASGPSIAFYRDVLGFDVMARIGDTATFLAVDGYHHHLAANTWESLGAGPAGPRAAGLLKATFVLPSARERDRAAARAEDAKVRVASTDTGVAMRDPSGVRLELQSA